MKQSFKVSLVALEASDTETESFYPVLQELERTDVDLVKMDENGSHCYERGFLFETSFNKDE